VHRVPKIKPIVVIDINDLFQEMQNDSLYYTEKYGGYFADNLIDKWSDELGTLLIVFYAASDVIYKRSRPEVPGVRLDTNPFRAGG
jgi:hypothetical protein